MHNLNASRKGGGHSTTANSAIGPLYPLFMINISFEKMHSLNASRTVGGGASSWALLCKLQIQHGCSNKGSWGIVSDVSTKYFGKFEAGPKLSWSGKIKKKKFAKHFWRKNSYQFFFSRYRTLQLPIINISIWKRVCWYLFIVTLNFLIFLRLEWNLKRMSFRSGNHV